MIKQRVVLKWSTLILSAAVLAVGFENCGAPLAPLTQVYSAQSIYEMQSSADAKYLPGLQSSSTLVAQNVSGTTQTLIDPAFSDVVSFGFVAEPTAAGVVFAVDSGTTLDSALVAVASGKIRVYHYTDSNDYTYIEAGLPTGSNRIVVAVRVGTRSNNIRLLVNGLAQTAPVQTVGAPADFSYLPKTITFAAATVSRYAVYAEPVSDIRLNVLSRALGNTMTKTSVVFDSTLGENTGPTVAPVAATPQFLAAKAVIDTNCLGCHGAGSSNGDFSNQSAAQFVRRGLAISAAPAASPLYYRLNGALSGAGPRSMPQGGALSSADIAAIATWINSL